MKIYAVGWALFDANDLSRLDAISWLLGTPTRLNTEFGVSRTKHIHAHGLQSFGLTVIRGLKLRLPDQVAHMCAR